MLRKVEWKGTHLLEGGTFSADDAVLIRMPDGKLTASTVDVFTPVVDDPYLYGQIAAANSLSDIYAMGGVPRFALSILGYPTHLYSSDTAAKILQGAVDKAWEAGVVVGGGHTIKSSEVIFGMAVVGDFPNGQVLAKGGARPGDVLLLTKAIGTGILSTALKSGLLPDSDRKRLGELMSTLNQKAAALASECGASGCTDVTGFGLLGHLGEVARQAGLQASLNSADVPLLEGVLDFARAGVVPGGTRRNLSFAADFVTFTDSVDEAMQLALADAQTSGGLLLAFSPENADRFVARCAQEGQEVVAIGAFEKGEACVRVS